jgi:bacillithiol biosynthesis cysteine-adding enzyme BshC
MASAEIVPFRKIPHQSRLFLDYLDHSPAALSFYSTPASFANLEREARGALAAFPIPRREIAAVLKRQNDRFGGDAQTEAHIADLERQDSVAVVTGQQVGLFTGPLYTIYKSFTTIRLANQLRARGIPAVPIFWMDSEDHDLAEVTHATVLGPDGIARRVDFREMLFGGTREHSEPVGTLQFPASVTQVVGEYLAGLPDTAWKKEAASELLSTYHPGSTFTESFARLMTRLFRGSGLILFDPHDPVSKPLVSKVFRKAVAESDEIRRLLLERSRQIEQQGFNAQVSVLENSTVLFLHEDGERKALTRSGNHFVQKGGERLYAAEDLMRLVETEPERFSPNVLLRPLVQDHLFPTIAYVAGPAEITYFAQVQVLYQLFGRPMPVIWPRASFTVLDPETATLKDTYNLRFEDCLAGKHHLVEMLIQAGRSSAVGILQNLRSTVERGIEALRPAVAATDPSLGPALETTRRKVHHNIEGLQAKFVHLEARLNSELLDKAEHMMAACFPNKTLQERELGVHYFTAQHGSAFLSRIESVLDTESFAHIVVPLAPA